MPPSSTPKIQPWKGNWPRPQGQQTNSACKVDYGAKKGEVVILDGSGFMLKPFDAFSKPVLQKLIDPILKPTQQ